MPFERHRYPTDWEAIATSIKEKAGWACEHCGKNCRWPGEKLTDYIERTGYDAQEVLAHPTRFVLDGAHLDQNPGNNEPDNLRALCRVCHLNYDRRYIGYNMMRRLERWGQTQLPYLSEHEGPFQSPEIRVAPYTANQPKKTQTTLRLV